MLDGMRIPHRAQTSRVVDALAGPRGARQKEYLDAASGAPGDHDVRAIRLSAEDFGQVVDADRPRGRAMLWCHQRIARLPLGAAVVPPGPIRACWTSSCCASIPARNARASARTGV